MSDPSEVVSSQTSSTYWVAQTITIDDVETKLAGKQTVSSASFFCRHDSDPAVFKLAFTFNGDTEGWFSTYIIALNRAVTIGRLTFTLYNNEGKLLKKLGISKEFVSEKGDIMGIRKFCRFIESDHGTWRIVCELEYEASAPVNKEDPKIPSSSSGILKDLLKLLKSSKNADVTFLFNDDSSKADTIKILAHKAILAARSTYFECMFDSNMEESLSNEVKVPDAKPKVFRGMLEFLYSGQPPKDLAKIAMDLLALADKYGLHELKKMCESSIRSNLSSGNVVDALLVAEQHDCTDLMNRAKVVFRAHCGVLSQSVEVMDKLKTNPDLLAALLMHYCRE